MNPALQRPDRAARRFRHILVGALLNGDLAQKLPLVIRQPVKFDAEPLKIHLGLLLSCHRNVWHLLNTDKVPSSAHAADEVVDHDAMNPGAEVGAEIKTVLV